MTQERRVWNFIPPELQTPRADKIIASAGDIMFEPEEAGFINGYIGDTSLLTTIDALRTPKIIENSASRQKYQLSVAAVVSDNSDNIIDGVFYDDLVRFLSINGALTNDENRLFSTPFYSWSPPIDYDKNVNYAKYYWLGDGDAIANGNYVVKEMYGSQLFVNVVTNGEFINTPVRIVNGFPSTGNIGELIEDASSVNRMIYRYNGFDWILVNYKILAVGTTVADFNEGDVVYIPQTGKYNNRFSLLRYSTENGRWLVFHPIISDTLPENPVSGMIWEDITNAPQRIFRIFSGNSWQALTFSTITNLSGVADPNLWFYDIRMISPITADNNTSIANDYWGQDNWWVHYNDMGAADKAALGSNEQAIRIILEYWAGIESGSILYANYSRNTAPNFKLYTVDVTDNTIKGFEVLDSNLGPQYSPIYYYALGSGTADTVLGFPLSYNTNGEYNFDINIESMNITSNTVNITGYRYFKDVITGIYHSIWRKSTVLTHQNVDANGVFDVPANIKSNANHINPLETSRSQTLSHMASVIAAQANVSGNEYGINSYRWTEKNVDLGAVIIDCENSLLRTMALLTSNDTNLPDTIRYYSREYNRAIFRFLTKLASRFEDGVFFDVTGKLIVSPVDAVDDICTELFFAKSDQFPYYYSGMGTYIEKNVGIGGVAIIGSAPRPIMVPTSAAVVGTSATYKPEIFVDYDGITKIRGHDGSLYIAYNDGRDALIIELENRFFSQVPDYFKTESLTFSSRFALSNFALRNYYGNFIPTTSIVAVDKIVDNYLTLTGMQAGTRVFSNNGCVYADWSGNSWYSTAASVDDVFLNKSDNSYYIFNGFITNKINYWNFNNTFDYSYNEYLSIIRRDFERWSISQNLNFVENNNFDQNNRFTWNYRTSGLEGYYAGIYSRIFRTPRINSHPWEVFGYTIQPGWWTVTYPPTTVKSDGTPRYSNTHPMWDDLRNGVYNRPQNLTNIALGITAPFPIDINGELVDPITAGIVSIESLDMERISENWVFGDGSPTEQSFISSVAYPFSVSLAGYLMKPGVWLDVNWAHLYIDVGQNQVWNGPYVVYNETLTRVPIADIPISLGLDSNGSVITTPGVQMWLAEYVKRTGQNTNTVIGNIVNNSLVQLGWRASGFLNNNRTVVQKLSGTRIPFEDMNTIIHTTPPIEAYFSSGMVIVRDGTGYRVYGYDLFNPFFTIDEPNVPLVGGLTEVRQEFTATVNQNVFTMTQLSLPLPNLFGETASLAVILNGVNLQPIYYTVNSSTTLTLNPNMKINAGDVLVVVVLTTMSNPSTRLKTFKVKGVTFTYASEGTGNYVNYEYGHYFDTAPQVINFMIGYGRYLQKQGWVFEDMNAGSPLDWINGAKQFATWVLSSDIALVQGDIPTTEFFFSPIAKKAKFSASFGTVTNIQSFQNGAYGILNSNALPVNSNKIDIKRINDTITINSTPDNEDIYGIRLYVVETQHAVFFSNITKFGDLIYDPLLSLEVSALKVNAYRTKNWTGKFEANGFVIQQNSLIPNFEKQVTDINRYYDRIDTVDDPVKRDSARALVGWVPNDVYMDPIGAEDRSRFDYFVGMIKAKGTTRPILAFAKGTPMGTSNVEISENWLWKIGDFGDTRKAISEFVVKPTEIMDDVQVIRFIDTASSDNRILTINSFNRNSPSTTRWVYPPTTSTDGLSNVEFPTNKNCVPQTKGVNYNIKIIDRSADEIIAELFHYDPQIGKFDPETLTQIDYWGPSDPARYTDGYGATYSPNDNWGETQIGKIWWDVTNLGFADYTTLLPDYRSVAKEWGRLKYFKVVASLNGDVLTLQTLDAYTGLPAAHGFVYDGFTVTISDMNPVSLNGIYAVTVVDTTTLQTVTNAGVSLVANTGTMTVGSVDVYQWVRSSLTPAQYIAQGVQQGTLTALPYGLENASYVTSVVNGQAGNSTVYYYYWVKSLGALSTNKEFTAQNIAARLQDPTGAGLSWFAPINENSLLLHLGGLKFENGYSIQVTVDSRKWDSHDEWLVSSETSSSITPPIQILNKIVDSILGSDVSGNPVPCAKLGRFERYGMSTFPAQSLFSNVNSARNIFLNTINSILTTYYINDNILLKEIVARLPDNYWTYSNYINPLYTNPVLVDTVISIGELNRRTSLKYFINGDIVKVVQSGITSPWTNTQTPIWFILENKIWTPIVYEKCAVQLQPVLLNDPVKTRELILTIFGYFSILQRNELISNCLYEMLYQNPKCDWVEKSSYVDMRIATEISTAPYVQPDYIQAVVDNFSDVKPFHTKLRNLNVIESVLDNAEVIITEEPIIKINELVNRLNCDVAEEGGADGFPADVRPSDYTHPYFNNFGIDEYYYDQTIVCDATAIYTVVTKYPPFLYKSKIDLYYKGVLTQLDAFGLSMSKKAFDNALVITFSSALSSDFSFVLSIGRSFYPDLPADFEHDPDNVFINYYGKDLEHRTYTYMQNGFGYPCQDGPSEERVESAITDNAFISLKTNYTNAFAGADGMPADLYGADVGLTDNGVKDYFMSTTPNTVYPAGTYAYPTSTVILSIDGIVFEDFVDFTLVEVIYQGQQLVLGVDYNIEFSSPYNRVVLTNGVNPLESLTFVYNGWNVGDIGGWVYVSSPSMINYNEGCLTLTTPTIPLNQFIILDYKNSRPGNQQLISFTNVMIVNDELTSATINNITYTNLPVNTYNILLTDTGSIVMWNGTVWDETQGLSDWTSVYVINSGNFYISSGGQVIQSDLTSVGQAVEYNNFGRGIVSATYAYGQNPQGSIDTPSACQIYNGTSVF